jgi:DNA (cytosine-5)-methyltransferase 1
MFPQAVRAVREARPRAFIVENVKGLTRSAFASYFEHIVLQLTYPDLEVKANEPWTDHLARLERYHTKGARDGLRYNVVYQVLNAADYGVPQRRERVFIVGFRSDQKRSWSFPTPTHSEDALLCSQRLTGEYWETHRVPRKERSMVGDSHNIDRLRDSLIPSLTKPWRTVRDAISELPIPAAGREVFPNHSLVTGAKSYPGHTGSPLDQPAKTLKAGAHGVPGGENMLLLPSGQVRYFTVRESARLQTFPDDYHFSGSWGEAMRQLGNAVPVELGKAVADSVADELVPAA